MIKMTKTWDEFIARQVEAVLKGERVSNEVWDFERWGGPHTAAELVEAAKGPGLVWLWIFRRWPEGEYWWVNLTQKKVIRVRKTD
jgi:hypothetical protein